MSMIKKFFEYDGASGILLMVATVAALILMNTPLGHFYEEALHTYIGFEIGPVDLKNSIHHWINDGLMAVFFLVVGLEIKRELLEGSLKDPKVAILPVIAALGGVILPAGIFAALNHSHPETSVGWGIPMATDIAFAVGVLSILGRRVPSELKVLLLSLAVIDDLIAIMVIAIFYTANISFIALGIGAIALAALITLNKMNVRHLTPYLIIGFILWVAVLQSGVHATIAGVALAFCIPINITKGEKHYSPLKKLEHALYAWAAFLIMPIFAFANAGFSLQNVTMDMLLQPLSLGIFLGLFVGKQVGVFSFIFLTDKFGWIKKPSNIRWVQIYGLALVTGIGFTVSLFIGNLAFENAPVYLTEVRISVLLGSMLSAILGYMVLRVTCKVMSIEEENINPIQHPEIFADDSNEELTQPADDALQTTQAKVQEKKKVLGP